ncbi:hypothetical protein FQN50_005726 [Emmonsiellopsis sp. PD_5]|nr:hypothetical protein FQN50_005726 [Emmonsiellopsis sp. PD_5]
MSSKRLQTVTKFLNACKTLDPEIISPLLAENYTQHFAPASLNMPRTRDKQVTLASIAGMRNILADFPFTVKEYIESEGSNQVVVWVTSRPVFREDVMDDDAEGGWECEGEYVFMLTVDGSGESIVRNVEFLDSLKAVELMGLIKRAEGNREKREARGGVGVEGSV